MDIKVLRKYIPKEIDITDLLSDLYYKGKVAMYNYIYDNNINIFTAPMPSITEFMIDELYTYYDLNVDEVEVVQYTSGDLSGFKAGVNKLLKAGYTNMGLLLDEIDLSENPDDIVLIGIKKPQDLGLLRGINKPKDPNQEAIHAAFNVLISNKFKAWEEPFIRVDGNFIEISSQLGDRLPQDFDFMKYLIIHKNDIIKLIEDTIGIKPFYAKVIRNDYYGEMRIRYEVDNMDTLIGLLKIQGLPISYLDMLTQCSIKRI